MKKLLSILLTVLTVLAIVPEAEFSFGGSVGGDIAYTRKLVGNLT